MPDSRLARSACWHGKVTVNKVKFMTTRAIPVPFGIAVAFAITAFSCFAQQPTQGAAPRASPWNGTVGAESPRSRP